MSTMGRQSIVWGCSRMVLASSSSPKERTHRQFSCSELWTALVLYFSRGAKQMQFLPHVPAANAPFLLPFNASTAFSSCLLWAGRYWDAVPTQLEWCIAFIGHGKTSVTNGASDIIFMNLHSCIKHHSMA